MDNRERDKMNKNTGSTSGSDVNRDSSSRIGKDKSDSSADFDKSSGQSEKWNDPNSRGSSKSSGYGKTGDSGSSSGSRPRRRPTFVIERAARKRGLFFLFWL